MVAQIYPATENFSAPPCERAHRRHSVRQTNGEGREAPDAFSAFLAGRDESNWSWYRCWGPASLTAASDSFQQHGACLGGSALDRGNDGKRRFGGAAGSHSDARLVGRDLPCVAFWRGRHPKALEDVVLIPIAPILPIFRSVERPKL